MIDNIQSIAMPQRTLELHPLNGFRSEAAGQAEQAVFEKMLRIDDKIVKADNLIANYVAGAEIPVHELMMAIANAKSELSIAVEIRDRVSAAYKEITSMQI